jgi:hypothetical protein
MSICARNRNMEYWISITKWSMEYHNLDGMEYGILDVK